MTTINLNLKNQFKKNINNDDINKFLFINGIMGKITEIDNNNIYIIPYAKAYYKKITIDEENNTYKIYYKYKAEQMDTIKINIYHKLYFILLNYTFNNVLVCSKYQLEADILNEIIETDKEAERSIFKTYLMNDVKKYIIDKAGLTPEEKTQKKQEFKNKFQYEPDELKKYLSEIIFNWGFGHAHYKILNDAINEIYETEEEPTPPTPKHKKQLYAENYILY